MWYPRASYAVSLQYWSQMLTLLTRHSIRYRLQKHGGYRHLAMRGGAYHRTKSGHPHGTISTPSVRSLHCRHMRTLHSHWRPWLEPWREPTVKHCLTNITSYTEKDLDQKCFTSCTPWGGLERNASISLSDSPRQLSRMELQDL